MLLLEYLKRSLGTIGAMRRELRKQWRRVPLLGALADVRTKDHTEALTEVGLNLVLSTVPIWFGALIMMVAQSASESFMRLVISNMHSGEFCLYSTALLAPLYYFIFKNYPNRPQFPSGRSFMVIAALIILTSGGLFVVQRTGMSVGAQHANGTLIFTLSWQVYFAAIVVVYLAHVYKNFMETGGSSITSGDTQDFVSDFISGGDNNGD